MDNLQILTIDGSQYEDSDFDRINPTSPRIFASYVMKASNCFKMLIFRFKAPRDSQYPGKIPLFIRELKEKMRSAPGEEQFEDDDMIL